MTVLKHLKKPPFSIDDAGNPKYISYYDKENKRKKQIDLDKPHMGVSPHTHHGYTRCFIFYSFQLFIFSKTLD